MTSYYSYRVYTTEREHLVGIKFGEIAALFKF